ncbi:hypothetical protein VTN31DRAFT_1338 [Thermomyces dupontii]|uniref:uncharacterized protein n=1 Tax=Talaromyces thermophilus TaxID=28565 RepID=UPI0037424294
MARKTRQAAQAATQSIRSASSVPAASDEELVDAPDVNEDADAANTADDPEENPDVNPNRDAEPESEAEPKQESDAPQEPDAAAAEPKAEGEPDTDAAATPAAGSETPAEPETPRTVGRTSAIPRKRRAGRPPKNRPPDWDLVDVVGSERPSVSTPSKRRRGRPSAGGGRWGRRGGQSNTPTKVVVDKDGTTLDVVDDEVVVPEDPAGEKKVDKNGYLQGGREYRVRTFTLLGRGERLYMLSTEPARCVGFRDSYLFFQKHKHLFKIIIDDEAKRDLIEREIIPHSYKGRAIGVVTARSVFREFGAKIIIGGRKVIDDYHEQAARERGDVEGELAVPEDKLPPPGEPYNRNQFVAWHGASSVYHTNAPSGPLPGGRAGESGKRRIAVTGDNWMVEHAREASRFNSAIAAQRRANLDGVYDPHTNTIQYPKIMQPTHARWERLPLSESPTTRRLTEGMSSLQLSNGIPTEDRAEQKKQQRKNTIFPPVPPGLARRFAVVDIVYETPESHTLGRPGPDGDMNDIGPNGVLRMLDPEHPEFMTPEILAELPPECKEALVEAAAREYAWKSKWNSEAVDGARVAPLKSYAWYP